MFNKKHGTLLLLGLIAIVPFIIVSFSIAANRFSMTNIYARSSQGDLQEITLELPQKVVGKQATVTLQKAIASRSQTVVEFFISDIDIAEHPYNADTYYLFFLDVDLSSSALWEFAC